MKSTMVEKNMEDGRSFSYGNRMLAWNRRVDSFKTLCQWPMFSTRAHVPEVTQPMKAALPLGTVCGWRRTFRSLQMGYAWVQGRLPQSARSLHWTRSFLSDTTDIQDGSHSLSVRLHSSQETLSQTHPEVSFLHLLGVFHPGQADS